MSNCFLSVHVKDWVPASCPAGYMDAALPDPAANEPLSVA
jgi:hypothetical protein